MSKGSRQRSYNRVRYNSNPFWDRDKEFQYDDIRESDKDAGTTGVSSPPQTETLVPEVPEDLLQREGDDPEGTL